MKCEDIVVKMTLYTCLVKSIKYGGFCLSLLDNEKKDGLGR
jgi:hypothetical protein